MSSTASAVRVDPDSTELADMSRTAAERHGVPAREVLVRLLLHLPRVASADGVADPDVAEVESDRLARELALATGPYREWQSGPPGGGQDVTNLDLEPLDDATARVVLERFHYLNSYRPGSDHFGGVARTPEARRLAALMTLSPLDVPTIEERLPAGVDPSEVLVLARVFAFEWAPHNTLSFLMAKLIRELRRRPDGPRLLVTYLNPNVGFTGASYRAANWSLWAREDETRYAYLDDRYVTDRELARTYGTSDPDALPAQLGRRVAFSRMRLRPLDLYAYPLDPHLRSALDTETPVSLSRP